MVRSEAANAAFGQVSTIMLDSFQSPSYSRSVTSMKNGLEPLRNEVEEYYRDRGFQIPREVSRLSKGLVTSTSNEVDTELGAAAFDKEVINPMLNALQHHINTGSTKDAMLKDIEHRTRDRFAAFTQVKADTILSQYGRRLNDLYGQTFARLVRYVGPDDAKNRDFCDDRLAEQRARKSKAFTVAEVKQWPVEYAPWDGMIPGTDRGSIFVNAGGYNCRHHFQYLND